MKILSLFDGMACGFLAMQKSKIPVSKYIAYEIDKYAIKTATHNFPMIEENGDVFNADFTEYEGFDFLIGGSPCTYWSIAQKNNRETQASGIGWELFSQYVRALREAKPKYFIYENNKSMSNAIRESISNTFGFEPICINSALVSAQNRQRLYWCGIRQADGSYMKADIPQPEDRGILLKDILEGDTDREKARAVIGSIGRTTTREYFVKSQGTIAFEPVNITPDGKSQTIKAQYQNTSMGKSININAGGGGAGGKTGLYAIPVKFENGIPTKAIRYADGKTYDVYTVKDGQITIKGKSYPIKLADGYYIIRKLTVKECMRLQTVPEWFEFPVSNSQAYKMLGNGWTVDVIAHILNCICT